MPPSATRLVRRSCEAKQTRFARPEILSALGIAGTAVVGSATVSLVDWTQSIAPVYDRFTEGFATADLQAARTLLEGLSP